MNFFEKVGLNILDILVDKDINQRELADAIGVSKQVMTKIIKGQKAINAFEITKIGTALSVSIEDLIRDRDVPMDFQPVLMFMGEIKKQETKEKLLFLNDVINDLISLEEWSND